MSSSDLQKEWASSYLSGGSMAYVDSLYEDYLANPNSVSADWKAVFDALPKVNDTGTEVSNREVREFYLEHANKRSTQIVQAADNKQYQVADLINAYRSWGHLIANLDPLGITKRESLPILELEYHKLSQADLNTTFFSGTSFNGPEMQLSEIVKVLKKTYCGSIGIEYMHIFNNEEIEWLQQRIETTHGQPKFTNAKKIEILKDLIAADGLERYLGTRYVGQKRFSLEGGDALLPMMKELISQAGQYRVKELVIGMAHRGRLNVLVNVLGKSPEDLFQEFEGKKVITERTGDVKYHLGFSSDIKTGSGEVVHLALAFNPSHLEIIGPVVEGSVRARLVRRGDMEQKESVVPIIIHGDAAFCGQGVVMETFNFSQARGYTTGGTIHIVVNNQIGFTTSNPEDARSTPYCTDIAKMVEAPVLHVNGDDPEAVVFATIIAFEYRMKFKRDIVIDLVCYRRHGHNEADEPSVTQPVMYKIIKSMRPLRETYANQLIKAEVINSSDNDKFVNDYRSCLDEGKNVVDIIRDDYDGKFSADWIPYIHGKWMDKVDTTIPAETLQHLAKQLHSLPEGFKINSVVQRLFQERDKMTAGELPLNWGYAETMAYASLLQDGYGVRLSGQDCGRGTFAHRHAVLHEAETNETYIPLEKLAAEPTRPFVIIDSVLSEEAVLAFEYGYASSAPMSLVLWEAQFGDFANGAQVVIDQFISSGEQKWGRLCGLVMLLPHGYEGQGPEHSSARLERYMQLCAQQNIQVCTPTTPAQMFHLLRRQMIRDYRKPLIVMTPKSLLRHKLAVSSLDDLTKGKFHTVIPEVDELNREKVTRVVLCCGKVYYDLLQMRREKKLENVAIVRIEQLYPFPKNALIAELKKYPMISDYIWCQEEPQNQGVWYSSQHNMKACLPEGKWILYAGRGSAAAPAAGSVALHEKQQKALVEKALMGLIE